MEYNRLIAYIYSYSGGLKGENAGFAKIEIRNDILKIKITIQGGLLKEDLTGSVKMFYREEEKTFWVTLGEMNANNLGGNFEYAGNGEDIENSGQGFNNISGMIIEFRGEEKYIFPFTDEADVILNTAHIYEIGILKVYAEPLLYSVKVGSPYYQAARRLLDSLKVFFPISSEYLASDNVLREFIGKSEFNEG